MLQGWLVVAVALGYIGFLFVVASYGDRARQIGRSRLLIYPLSLAIYCTSWTFFGSVGLASRTGYDFLTIYVGPILMIGLGAPLIMRIVRLAKAQNITSIADFIAARYGKSQAVAATVALIAIVGTGFLARTRARCWKRVFGGGVAVVSAARDGARMMRSPSSMSVWVWWMRSSRFMRV